MRGRTLLGSMADKLLVAQQMRWLWTFNAVLFPRNVYGTFNAVLFPRDVFVKD